MINNPAVISPSLSAGFKKCENGVIELRANEAKQILAENESRKYVAIVNNSSFGVTLSLGSPNRAEKNKGIIIQSYGSFEINSNNLYLGIISAISDQPVKISFVECEI